jgi:hypothetical protein
MTSYLHLLQFPLTLIDILMFGIVLEIFIIVYITDLVKEKQR